MLKVIVDGANGSGKTSFIRALRGEPFDLNHFPTIGVEFGNYTLSTADGNTRKVQLWELAGGERFRQICKIYYRSIDAVVLLFDLNQRWSFECLSGMVVTTKATLREFGATNVKIAIFSNKSDLPREVSRMEIQAFVESHGIDYSFEGSIKTNGGTQPAKILEALLGGQN